jgi:hypothetical protein
MSVENIPHPVLNPVRDDTPYAVLPSSAVTDMSSLTGFFRENDLFFYRHPVPHGTLGQDTPWNVPMSVEKQRTDVFVISFCLSSEIKTTNDEICAYISDIAIRVEI